jgi:hypothetical protein
MTAVYHTPPALSRPGHTLLEHISPYKPQHVKALRRKIPFILIPLVHPVTMILGVFRRW